MKLIRNVKAEEAVVRAQLRCLEKKLICSRPCVEGTRYDLIFDYGDSIKRIQVKYVGKVKNGAIPTQLQNQTGAGKRYDKSEVDELVIYVKSLNKLYKVPIDIFGGKSAISLRVADAKNNQISGIIFAKDFEW